MIKKILLISPNPIGLEDKLSYPPLGLLYVASNMNKGEWEPEISVLTDDKFDKFDYEYYGISVHSISTVKETERLINLILAKNKDAEIYIGGSAASLVSKRKNVRCIYGEGEQFFGKKDVSNLDNINFPARDMLPFEYISYKGKVHHTDKISTTIIATRGCVYNCNFCDRVTLGRKFRKRSVDNVTKEVEHLITNYGIEWLRFIDDCITIDKKWFLDLCEGLKKYKIEWTCLSRADLIDKDTLSAMRQAGCREIFFGFESGSQKILDLMNKRSTVERNKQAIDMCKEAGITSCAYMLFGFPGEDEATVDETIKFLETAKPDKSRISTFVPVPNTDVWLNPDKYNVKIKDNYQDYWYFDKHDFALEYRYLKDNNLMQKLRDKMLSFYEDNYKEKWICSTSLKV